MTYYIEENDFSDINSDIGIYDCIDEKSPYLVIVHYKDRTRQGYYSVNSETLYYCVYGSKDLLLIKILFNPKSKEELKIWMDLNGYKMTDKIVVYYPGTKKIHFEMFKLDNT